MEDKQRHLFARLSATLITVEIPKIAFVEERQQGVNMQEILLHEFIEDCSGGYSEASLGVEIIHVLWHHIMEIADGNERIIRECDIRIDHNLLLTDPKGNLWVSYWVETLHWD